MIQSYPDWVGACRIDYPWYEFLDQRRDEKYWLVDEPCGCGYGETWITDHSYPWGIMRYCVGCGSKVSLDLGEMPLSEKDGHRFNKLREAV